MKELVIKDFCYISDGNYSSKYPRSDEFKESGIPFIRANNLVNGTVVSDDMYFISPEKHSELRKGHLRTDDVLITTRGNIGQTAVVPAEFHDANINAQIVLLRVDKEKILPKYLEYALHTDTVVQQIESSITGTALKQLPVGRLEKIKVKIHPKNEQEHIVSVLQKIDALTSAQKEQLETIETIVKSRFIELFGDPKSNSFNWKQEKLSSQMEVRGRVGWKGYKKEDLRDSGPLVLGATHLSDDGRIDLSEPVFLSEEKYFESPEIMVKRNDLIFAQRGSLGKVGLVETEYEAATINPCVLILRPIQINPQFARYFLMIQKDNGELDELNSGSTIPMITQKSIGEFGVIVPPMELQEQFAVFVKQTDKSKLAVQQSLEKLEILKKTLMQQYFG